MIIQTMGQKKEKTIGKVWHPYNLEPKSFDLLINYKDIWVAAKDNESGLYYSLGGRIWKKAPDFTKVITDIKTESLENQIHANMSLLINTDSGLYVEAGPEYVKDSNKTIEADSVNIVNNVCFRSLSNVTYCAGDRSFWPNESDFVKTNIDIDNINSIKYNNGIYLAKIGGYIYYSSDGITWTKNASNLMCSDGPYWCNNMWFAVQYYSGTDLGTYCSTDGINWEKVSDKRLIISEHEGPIFIGMAKEKLDGDVFTQEYFYYSEDGKHWTMISDLTHYSEGFRIKYCNGVYIIGANGGSIYYSYDGKHWQRNHNPQWFDTNQGLKLVNINRRWICGSIWNGVFYSDSNGQYWKQSTISDRITVNKMVYNEHIGLLVAATDEGIYYSE